METPALNPTFHSLPVDEEALDHYCRSLSLQEPGRALRALARTVASSPAWSAMPGASALVCRLSPRPRLAIVGSFDAAATASLEAQAQGLSFACRNLRYIDYPQVVADCERLASRLVEELGREELGRRRFIAVPRGGLVVLGLLACILDLDRRQLFSATPSLHRPLVVVDDCALSGARCAEFLSQHDRGDVVFAHLYSHHRLRSAVESRETRVTACIAARDLEERAPFLPDWRRQWSAGSGRKTYWLGCPEALCLPWNEPDRSVWNPATRRPERAWSIVPQELCLKNRPASGSRTLPVRWQAEARGPLAPREEVLCCDLDDRILVGNLASGEVVALEGVARGIWRSVLRHGRLDQVVDDLARDYEAPVPTLRRDVIDLTEQLSARGFLGTSSS